MSPRPTKRRVLALTISIAMVVVSGAHAETERIALVVGNAHYSRLPANDQLRNPVNDADDVARELRALGFAVTLLTNASLQNMEDAVAQLGERLSASADSVGFFYYAGHGVQADGKNYLIPSDAYIAGPGFLGTKALQLQSVLDTLQQANNRLNIVVLDACRNNPFGWTRGLGDRGLAVVGSQPQGSIVAYAAAAGKTAEDGSEANGVYTGQLLRYLQTPGLDILDMFRDVGKAVSTATDGVQQPAIYSQFNGTFYLQAPGTGTGGVPPALSPKPTSAGGETVSELDQKLKLLNAQLQDLQRKRDQQGRRGAIFTGAGVLGAGAAVLCFLLASNALRSYQSSATPTDATTFLSQFETFGGLFLGSAVIGAGGLVTGGGFFLAMPSLTETKNEIRTLDLQMRAANLGQ